MTCRKRTEGCHASHKNTIPIKTGDGPSFGIFGMIWDKFPLLWLRFLGVDDPAVRLRQVKRPAAAGGLGLKGEREHRWRTGYPTLNPSGAGASALPRAADPRRLCRQTYNTILSHRPEFLHCLSTQVHHCRRSWLKEKNIYSTQSGFEREVEITRWLSMLSQLIPT